jgi:hypothetical protein
MMFDLKTIEESLAKAKADVAFWQSAKSVLSDPRMAALAQEGDAPSHRVYGNLKKAVYGVLPGVGEAGMTTAEIVEAMKDDGYVFNSKNHAISVNEALNTLAEKGEAIMVGRNGVAKLWTRGEIKKPAEAGS